VTGDQKSTLAQALDLVVYGPLGLAITAKEDLPQMVEKGRNRVLLARMIGQHATRHGQRMASQALKQSAKILVDLGILPGDPRPVGGRPSTQPGNGRVAQTAAPQTGRSAPVAAPPSARAPAAAPAELAIPGYDSLSASQVVQRLAGLAPDELEAVQSYEAAGRGRRTILSKIAQLQSGRP